MSDWRRVLEQRRSGPPGGPYDMRPYWRATAYRDHADEPDTLARAHAFARVLDRCEVHRYEGDALYGSIRGFWSSGLPGGVTAEGYRAAVAEHDARGQRDFRAGHDHTLPDYPTLLTIGIDGYAGRARDALRDHRSPGERAFLDSVLVALDGFERFVARHAECARSFGDGDAAAGLAAIAGPPPTTLHEAVQLVWLTHLALWSEGRYAMALGRVDQYLAPFYDRHLREGGTRAEALDLICHLWARLDEIGEVQNVCVGGLTPGGADATNELSYICIEATRVVGSPHTNLSARFHDATPDRFHTACFECIRTGIGFPAIFNDHVLLEGLAEIGIPDEVARDYCMVGCIETMLPGRQGAWSDSRFNAAGCLLEALVSVPDADAQSYETLERRFGEVVARRLGEHAARIDAHVRRFPVGRFADPFLSALTRDCIGRGRDINDGGAEYERFHGVAVMGLGTVADSLAAVKKLVFEEKRVSLERLLGALERDYEGEEALRCLLERGAPKYGNDVAYVDEIAARVVEVTSRECLKHRLSWGGRFVAAMAANVQNISAGRETGATPDGRRARAPLSDAASPSFGRDENGPTAFLNSVARPDYHRVLGGTVVNMKFEPEHFTDDEGAARFRAFTKAFVAKRVHQLQFNFTGTETLLAARADPERHRNLVVRVSGFSAYFVGLSREVQDDVIRRRAHVMDAAAS